MEYDFSNTQIKTFPKKRILICGAVLGIVVFSIGFLIGFFAFKHTKDLDAASDNQAKTQKKQYEEYHDRFLKQVSSEKLGENLR